MPRLYQLKPSEKNFPSLQFDEKVFGKLFENALDALLLTDSEGKFVAVNPPACELFGVSREAILGRTFQDFLKGECQFPANQEGRGEIELLCPKGETKTVEFTQTPDLAPGFHLSAMRDITVTRLEAEARRRSEERFRFLSEAGEILSSSLDKENIISRIAQLTIPTLADYCLVHLLNEAGELESIEVASNDPTDRENLLTLSCIPWKTNVRNTFRAALESRKPQVRPEFSDEDYRQIYSDPEHVKLLQKIHPRSIIVAPLIGKGQLLGTISVARSSPLKPYDLADLDLVAEAARRVALTLENIKLYRESLIREKYQRFLSESTKVFVSSLNSTELLNRFAQLSIPTLADLCFFDLLDQNGNLRRLAWASLESSTNPNWDAVKDWAPSTDKIKHSVVKVLLSGKPEIISDFTEQTMKDLAMSPEHFKVMRATRTHSLMVVPLIFESKPFGVLTFGYTVSKRLYSARELETALEVANRITIALKNAELYKTSLHNLEQLKTERTLREQFVSALTHDLRTPLTAARMAAQLTIKSATQADRVILYSSKVIQDIDRLDRMIRDLLDANRIRAGQKLPLNIKECNLSALSTEILEELTTFYGDRFVLQEKESIKGLWDANALQRVIENICNNAVKYGFPNTPILISLIDRGTVVQIAIHNEGEAIPPREQTQLFDYFHRSQVVTKRGQKGWGIGLTLVRGVAEAHGGSVHVESEPDKGTTFIVELPKDARPFQVQDERANST